MNEDLLETHTYTKYLCIGLDLDAYPSSAPQYRTSSLGTIFSSIFSIRRSLTSANIDVGSFLQDLWQGGVIRSFQQFAMAFDSIDSAGAAHEIWERRFMAAMMRFLDRDIGHCEHFALAISGSRYLPRRSSLFKVCLWIYLCDYLFTLLTLLATDLVPFARKCRGQFPHMLYEGQNTTYTRTSCNVGRAAPRTEFKRRYPIWYVAQGHFNRRGYFQLSLAVSYKCPY